MKFSWAGLSLGIVLAASHAQAALTQSEQAQIRQFLSTAQLVNAARVRSFVARPDLSAEESATAMREAVTSLSFDEPRLLFFRELVFGGASQASRPVIVPAAVKGLLARADVLLSKNQTDLEGDARALAELTRIYGFLDAEIANAGHPKGWAHDPSAGIPSSTYDECSKALGDHIEKNQKILRSDATVALPLVRVRAQAQLALVDMIGDAPTRRVDAADKLGLQGPRRAFLTDLGLLVVDSARADGPRVDRVKALLERLPLVRTDAEAIVFGDGSAALRARNLVLNVRTPLEATPWSGALFTDEIDPGPVDASMVELTRELSVLATRRALDKRPELRLQGERDYRSAGADPNKLFGKPLEPTVDGIVATAVALLAIDAPRAMDLAFVRVLAGKPDSALLLTDALGALAAMSPATQGGLTVPLGRAKPDGTTESLNATNVQVAPNGAVSAFTFAGHTWNVDRLDNGNVSVRRDAVPITLAALGSARVPMSDGPTWTTGSVAFTRLLGAPRAGVAPGIRARLVGTGPQGWDAIATALPAGDFTLDASVGVRGEGGIGVRASGDGRSLRGALLTFSPAPDGDTGKIGVTLVAVDDAGQSTALSPTQALPLAPAFPVKISVKGTKIEATVGATASFKGTLPASLARGQLAIYGKRGATVDVTSLATKGAGGAPPTPKK